jgi:HD domain-containing protein
MNLTSWAANNASLFLSPLGNRWLHVQQVAQQARKIELAVPEPDRDLLVAAAYLHDIGYARQLVKTGFHPLDGGRWVRDNGGDSRLAALVAHHSCAVHEARIRGLDRELIAEFEIEQSATYDALVYCDMTVGPTGRIVSFDERVPEILNRYHPQHEVSRSLTLSRPALAACCARTATRLRNQ